MGKSQITSLPLSEADRVEFVEAANVVFESVLRRMDVRNPGDIRKLWDAEYYVDQELLDKSMLPIDRGYALSLIDAFLVHYVLGLVAEADRQAG